MTPKDLEQRTALWKIQCALRKPSEIVCNDPLFAPRQTIPTPPERERTLHARFGWEWLEVGNECEFTGSIKYARYQGELLHIAFEIEYYVAERLLRSFWKETTIRKTYWVPDDQLQDKYPHSKNNEDVTYNCEVVEY